MRVIGCISGTSYDAIDAAVVDLDLTDGGTVVTAELVGTAHSALPPDVRTGIAAVLPPAATSAEDVCRLDAGFGRAVAEVVAPLSERYGAELVVSHGQTVFHWVADGVVHGTLQLGNPAWIAERTGLPVVSDLRSRDIAAGGQGAPLVSILDAMLLFGDRRDVAALNLGGISNVTVATPDGPLAWDIGPANALIDAAVGWLTDGAESYDHDGARAARGRVHAELLDVLLDEPYYARPAPKSTGKELFHLPYLLQRLDRVGPVPDDDLIATVTELTARLVADTCATYRVGELVAAGGGTANPVLMSRIAALAPEVRVTSTDAYGVPSQAKESFCFALLGFLTWHGLPGTVPTATGASRASVLGSITPGRTPLRLPTPAITIPTRLHLR